MTSVVDTDVKFNSLTSLFAARAENERAKYRNRELWLAARNLLAVVKDGVMPSSPKTAGSAAAAANKPVKVCCKIGDIKEAGAAFPIVHVILDAIPEQVRERGVYPPDVLAERFRRVRRVARRVTMIDDTRSPTLGRYVLSYVQSLFVFRGATRVDAAAAGISSETSAFVLLDSADDCLRRGDLEQAVRLVVCVSYISVHAPVV